MCLLKFFIMNESFFVNIIFNLLVVSIFLCCLSLLFSSSLVIINRLYKIVLWLINIGFYEPYFNNENVFVESYPQLDLNTAITKYQFPKYNFGNLSNYNDVLIKFSIFATNIILFGIIFMRWVTSGYFPISNLYESLMFLTWCLLTLLLIAGYKIGFSKVSIIGCVVLPLCLFLIGFSIKVLPVAMQNVTPLVPALQSSWLLFHVSMMMLSYSVLLFGSLLSIMFLFLCSKTNRFKNAIEKNPMKSFLLYQLDLWSYRTIGIGFPFLTMGIISGAVWANEAWGSYWSWDPKETWALITWIIFATYLHARLIRNSNEKEAALLGSIGFFVIWICYLGVNFLGQGLHSYGWLS